MEREASAERTRGAATARAERASESGARTSRVAQEAGERGGGMSAVDDAARLKPRAPFEKARVSLRKWSARLQPSEHAGLQPRERSEQVKVVLGRLAWLKKLESEAAG